MNKIGLVYVIALAIFTGCSKDNDQEVLQTSEYTNKFISENEEIYHIESGSSSFEIEARNGCKIRFEENSFLKDGVVFNGRIRFRFVLITNRVDMIKSGMLTMYENSEGVHMLESGGEYFLQAYDDSDDKLLSSSKPYELFIPISLSGTQSDNMELFFMEDQSDTFWELAPKDTLGLHFNRVFSGEGIFRVVTTQFGWINIDAINYYSGVSYEFSFKYPKGFDNTNSLVFLVLDNYPNSVANLSIKVPENETGKIIFVARTNDHFHITYESFVATFDREFDFTDNELIKVPLKDFDDYLLSVLEE